MLIWPIISNYLCEKVTFSPAIVNLQSNSGLIRFEQAKVLLLKICVLSKTKINFRHS